MLWIMKAIRAKLMHQIGCWWIVQISVGAEVGVGVLNVRRDPVGRQAMAEPADHQAEPASHPAMGGPVSLQAMAALGSIHPAEPTARQSGHGANVEDRGVALGRAGRSQAALLHRKVRRAMPATPRAGAGAGEGQRARAEIEGLLKAVFLRCSACYRQQYFADNALQLRLPLQESPTCPLELFERTVPHQLAFARICDGRSVWSVLCQKAVTFSSLWRTTLQGKRENASKAGLGPLWEEFFGQGARPHVKPLLEHDASLQVAQSSVHQPLSENPIVQQSVTSTPDATALEQLLVPWWSIVSLSVCFRCLVLSRQGDLQASLAY